MTKPSYSFSGYRNKLMMTNFKYLLVEGEFDRWAFKDLLAAFCEETQESSELCVQIDTANILQFPRPLGCREKVEEFCRSVEDRTDLSGKFVGFIDREFRDFEFGDSIQDKLENHRILDKLVCSTGHSIENYLFYNPILRQAFRPLITEEWLDQALSLFELAVERTIRLACAASLARRDLRDSQNEQGKLEIIKKSISWKLLELNESEPMLNVEGWLKIFVQRKYLEREDANKLVHNFKEWCIKLENVEFKVIKRLCHGHVGFEFIWALLYKCAYETSPCNKRKEPEAQIRNLNNDSRFRHLTCSWATKALYEQCEYPKEVFEILELPCP